ITTADQLLQTPGLGRCELLCGKLVVMAPAGFEHGRIVANITGALVVYIEQEKLGVVAGAETGFQIANDPDTVRAPDVAFIRAERVPPAPTPGFFQGAPDLAVEVLSPSDRAGELLAKVHDWLSAGCLAVWVVDPGACTVSVYRSRDEAVVWSVSDELTGDHIVPGFSLPVAEIFAR
ncbi:MAG: Uma2 family endonuclease, partial [Planctomycetota bacterium]